MSLGGAIWSVRAPQWRGNSSRRYTGLARDSSPCSLPTPPGARRVPPRTRRAAVDRHHVQHGRPRVCHRGNYIGRCRPIGGAVQRQGHRLEARQAVRVVGQQLPAIRGMRARTIPPRQRRNSSTADSPRAGWQSARAATASCPESTSAAAPRARRSRRR